MTDTLIALLKTMVDEHEIGHEIKDDGQVLLDAQDVYAVIRSHASDEIPASISSEISDIEIEKLAVSRIATWLYQNYSELLPGNTKNDCIDLIHSQAQQIWGLVKHYPKRESGALNKIRSSGWAVAVHNDYRLRGESYTFWLFTKDGRALQGEGRTDDEALNLILNQIEGDS